MGNPEIQSSQFASTMEDPDFHKSIRADYLEDEVDLIAKARRRGRKTEAEDFREEYFYGRCKDKKTCIWPSGRGCWSDESSGITWVGVHGNDSICVVTKAGDLDLSRVHGLLIFLTKEEVFRNFRRTVISEIEDLAALAALADPEDPEDLPDPFRPCRHLETPLSKLCETFGKSIEKPFGVVSVVPVTDKVHQASSYEHEETKITKFLLEGLNREETSSDDESEIDEADEDTRIKHLLKLTRRVWRNTPEIPGFDGKETIQFLQEEMKRDASIKTNETVQESSEEVDEKTAIEFLEEKMRRTKDFTLEGTMQIAISAFQLLFKRNFNAEEIEVCVMDPDYFVYAEEADYKDIYVKHLETSEIEQLLVDMNEPGSGGSSSGGSSSGGSTITSAGSDFFF